MNRTHLRWLLELTSLPTAAGREQQVIDWVRRWAKARRVRVEADRFGNLTLYLSSKAGARPIYVTAHMDHPAFVVVEVLSSREVRADFRGGVADSYFVGSKVQLRGRTGVVRELHKSTHAQGDKRVTVAFAKPHEAQVGQIMTWRLPPARLRGDRLFAPACDDLAGAAAALVMLDTLRRRASRGDARKLPDVRVLLTRAEEVGFIGAIAACKAGSIPREARLVCLENSKSFAESPLGAGPIVRVGDRTSTFDPALTYQLSRIAQELSQRDPSFRFQRKLMPGGTCEASAFGALGYTASCLCLPLANYHNMSDTPPRVASESISMADFAGLVRLLVESVSALNQPRQSPPFSDVLDRLFAQRSALLG